MASEILSDVAEIVMGQSPPGESCNRNGEGIPLLNGPTEFGPHHPTPVQFTTDPRKHSKAGDVLFCVRGSTTGRMNWADQDYAIGRGIAAIRHKKGVKYQPFLRALIEYHLSQLLAQATGSTFPNVSYSQLYDLPCDIPSDAEQQAIACILGALDDKIELNRRMNETLEGIARAIFKSWFVDFDPVRAKAAGEQLSGLAPRIADLFPDAFVESELGEIPKGWNIGTLGMIANEVRNIVQPAEIEPGTPYVALQHMPRRCITLDSWDVADDIASAKLRFKAGDILFGKLRPYFHKVGPAPLDGVCSTDIVVCRPQDDLWYGLSLGHISSDAFVAYTDSGSTGTKMPRTNWRYMSAFKIALPPSQVAAQFSEIVHPMINRIRYSIFEQQSLTALRDTLLPKLISGELRVPDAKRIVGRCL